MVGPMSASATQPATARFLVGVDGSETAFNAVRWAAESAAAHGAVDRELQHEADVKK